MKPRITETRRRILGAIMQAELRNTYLTAREIAGACGEERRAADWAHGPLREMAWHGLVEQIGFAFDNARTWGLTDTGRAALSSTPPASGGSE